MALALNGGPGANPGPRRVFVLVDKGVVQGVFQSWDEAESYAEKHDLSLDHLLEFVTRRDHPEHLHLLSALWEDRWEVQGEWTRETPRWKRPPKKVRLIHYHAKDDTFQLLRKKEFNWESGLLLKVDPMAPDQVLEQLRTRPSTPQPPQWKPKLGGLNPVSRIHQDTPEVIPEPEKTEPSSFQRRPLIEEPEPPVDEVPERNIETAAETPEEIVANPPDDNSEQRAESPSVSKESSPLIPEDQLVEPTEQIFSQTSSPQRRKKKPLKLKRKESPKPIPAFSPLQQTADPVLESPGLDPAQRHIKESLEEAKKDLKQQKQKRIRKVWPARLIVAVVAVFAGWGGGLFWILKPEPTAQEIVSGLSSLNSADVITIEPSGVFFQLPVDPIQQQRWVRSLNLDPIPGGRILTIPFHHALSTWSKPDGFIRPPYAEIEVKEWWDLRLRKINYGFYHRWEDGSLLILDLEADMLIGWSHAELLPELLH